MSPFALFWIGLPGGNELTLLSGLLLFVAILGIPVYTILRRTGLPSFLTIFAFLPFTNLILLYVVAFSEWPKTAPDSLV